MTCMKPIGPAAPITATRSPARSSPSARRDRVAVGRRGAGRADPARQVVVDPPDVHRDRPPDPAAAQHDVDDPARREQPLELLDRGRRRRRSRRCRRRTRRAARPSRSRRRRRSAGAGRSPRPPERRRAGRRPPATAVTVAGRRARRAGAPARRPRARRPRRRAAGRPARASTRSRRGVRRLDAGPRLEERDGGAARLLVDRDQEALARPGLDDHPLVEEHVLLEPALEVVAEGGVRAAASGRCR